MKKPYPRWQQERILKALETRRVILLTGARQCGKTTLSKYLVGGDAEYRTLDDMYFKQSAEDDPYGFIKHDKSLLIIDEIQRVPDLLLAIKKQVDEDTRAGQFLLTGSANILALPSTQESLAGRVAQLRLRPLSQGELQGKPPIFIESVFNGNLKNPSKHHDKRMLIDLAMAGGYPEALLLNSIDNKLWYEDYIHTILLRDLSDVARINKHDQMKMLVETLADWSSKLMNLAQMCSSLQLKQQTLLSYINALESLYIVERLNPWFKTDYERVSKQSKLFMTDSGLMTSLLGWNAEQIYLDSDRSGKLIETFAFNELMAQIDHSYGEYTLSHYRDRQKREIDFIIENRAGELVGIEVKSGSNVGTKDFKHLKWFKENIAKDRPFKGIVLYSGEHIAPFGKDMMLVPFGALWA